MRRGPTIHKVLPPPSASFLVYDETPFNHDGLRKRDKFPSADNEDWIHEIH